MTFDDLKAAAASIVAWAPRPVRRWQVGLDVFVGGRPVVIQTLEDFKIKLEDGGFRPRMGYYTQALLDGLLLRGLTGG